MLASYLDAIASTNAPIAIPMRMLEVFLSPSTYKDMILTQEMDSQRIVIELQQSLVKKGWVITDFSHESSLDRSVKLILAFISLAI